MSLCNSDFAAVYPPDGGTLKEGVTMEDLSKHFSKREFACKCGKIHDYEMDSELIDKLEKLHNLMNAHEIIITSGYRCPEWSKSVGGYFNDAHTKGIASDIKVSFCDPDGVVRWYSSDNVAEGAERVGFSGIGIIDNTAVHVDVRNNNNYVNSHWYGDERTGNDNITTFQHGTIFDSRATTHTITVLYDGEKIIEKEI